MSRPLLDNTSFEHLYLTGDLERRTGRTIRLMLRIILAMSENPNQWVDVVNEYPTPQAHRYMIDWIKRVCQGELCMKIESRMRAEDKMYQVRFIK